jgi:hypothetical protein
MVWRPRDQSRAGTRRPPPAPRKRACSASPGSWRIAPRAPFARHFDARRAAPGHRGGPRRSGSSQPRRPRGVIGDRASHSCGCWASARPSGCKPPAFGPGGSTPPFHTAENARCDEPWCSCVQRWIFDSTCYRMCRCCRDRPIGRTTDSDSVNAGSSPAPGSKRGWPRLVL